MTHHPATKLKNTQPWIPFICIIVQAVLFFFFYCEYSKCTEMQKQARSSQSLQAVFLELLSKLYCSLTFVFTLLYERLQSDFIADGVLEQNDSG